MPAPTPSRSGEIQWQPASQLGDPFVSHGVVLVSAGTRSPPPKPPENPLRDRVARRCGIEPQNLELVFTSAKDVDIVLTSLSGRQIEDAIDKLQQTSELAAYRKHIRVRAPH
jgi:hypothetical protein